MIALKKSNEVSALNPKYIKTFKRLFHVGMMDERLKHSRGFSMEGRGLSVSECPDAWTKIAKLGGGLVWELTRPQNQFLDWLRLTKADREAVFTWGESKGLVHRTKLYSVQWYHSEQDETVEFVYEDREKALHELGDEAEALEEGKTLTEKDGWGGTLALSEFVGYPNGKLPSLDVADMLATAYADHLKLDGVFWNEKLDVYELSAPRSVISLAKLGQWEIRNKEECLQREGANNSSIYRQRMGGV